MSCRNFTPHEWFGPPALRHPDIQATNPAPFVAYSDICELFGARNEWVHEGRCQVRPFDPQINKASRDPALYRALKRDDYFRFRSAFSSALVWMGETPIE